MLSFLGDADAWTQIFEANRGMPQPYGGTLTDPDLIHIGWTLRYRHPVVGFSCICGC